MAPASRAAKWDWLTSAWTACVIGAAAFAFVRAGLAKTGGVWPIPLDDVYIHFDFARSAARGHPFTWVPGNGYSSGSTSPLYPLVLAIGYLVGLHGPNLGAFAVGVAVVALVDLSRSIGTLGGRTLRLAAPVALVAVPLLDWTWFSGMEVAFAMALLGRALASARSAESSIGRVRARHQLAAGAYLAALAVSRPECAVLAPLLGVAIAVRGREEPALLSLARSVVPTVLALALLTIANKLMTGEAASAGAVRKLITSSPYASSADVAVLVLKNFAEVRAGGIDVPLGGRLGSSAVTLLAVVACVDKRSRALAAPLFIGAFGALGLVCLNTTAPFQNMRYATPSLAMLLVAAVLGIDALVRRGRAAMVLAAVAGLAVIIDAGRAFPLQIDHFARASRNIREQQVELGSLLAVLPDPPRRIFLGDAGAIPYMADRPALDGLGLGGYRDLPFARASVHGVPAVIELIERLPPSERPDVLAIYDSWWPGVGSSFGDPLFDVAITDNVICGDAKKSVYRADWSLLEERTGPWLDRLDVGDLVDEAEHRYEMPHPHAGFVISGVLTDREGRRRYDAGRIIPMAGEERFFVGGAFARGAHVLRVRTDDAEARSLRISIRGAELPVRLEPSRDGAWSETPVAVEDIGPGDEVRVRAEDGAFRSFAYTIE